MRRDIDGTEAFMRERRHAEEDAALVDAIAPALRAPERLPDDFEARLFTKIRGGEVPSPVVGRVPRRGAAPWWRRTRAVELTPLAGLAWAAGFAGLVALGTLAAARASRDGAAAQVAVAPAASAARVDTVHVVRFVIEARGAERVALVGDFNDWAAGATPLAPTARAGVWTVDVALPAGRHEYAFVVDGQRWMADPNATVHHDEFGTESSVVTVGRAAPARS